MPVPAPLVLGVTAAFHAITLLLFGDIGYFSYKTYNDYNDDLYQDIGWNICLMILGFILLIWLMTIIIRADRTLRRIHDDLREKYGYNSYDDAYQKQLKYIFPVSIIKKLIENKLVIPYYKNDQEYKILAMFKQIILDADDDDDDIDVDEAQQLINE